MKYFIFIIMIICLSGCASTRGPSVTESVKTDRAYEVLNDSIPYIKGAAQVAVKLCLQYAEKETSTRDDLRLKVHIVAINLDGLLAKGDFSPGAVTKALKVDEDYINGILEAVAIIYTATYEKLAQNENAELSIRLLRALAQGVAAGTD